MGSTGSTKIYIPFLSFSGNLLQGSHIENWYDNFETVHRTCSSFDMSAFPPKNSLFHPGGIQIIFW